MRILTRCAVRCRARRASSGFPPGPGRRRCRRRSSAVRLGDDRTAGRSRFSGHARPGTVYPLLRVHHALAPRRPLGYAGEIESAVTAAAHAHLLPGLRPVAGWMASRVRNGCGNTTAWPAAARARTHSAPEQAPDKHRPHRRGGRGRDAKRAAQGRSVYSQCGTALRRKGKTQFYSANWLPQERAASSLFSAMSFSWGRC